MEDVEHHVDGRCCSHDHTDERQVYKLSTAEKLGACAHFRSQGAVLFRECQWERARTCFEKCLVYLDYTFAATSDEEEECQRVRNAALLNMAVCSLKTSSYRDVINKASLVLNSDPHNAKALYLRGKAHLHLDDFPAARQDVSACAALPEADSQVQRLLAVVQGSDKLHALQMRDFAADVFGSNPSSHQDILYHA